MNEFTIRNSISNKIKAGLRKELFNNSFYSHKIYYNLKFNYSTEYVIIIFKINEKFHKLQFGLYGIWKKQQTIKERAKFIREYIDNYITKELENDK